MVGMEKTKCLLSWSDVAQERNNDIDLITVQPQFYALFTSKSNLDVNNMKVFVFDSNYIQYSTVELRQIDSPKINFMDISSCLEEGTVSSNELKLPGLYSSTIYLGSLLVLAEILEPTRQYSVDDRMREGATYMSYHPVKVGTVQYTCVWKQNICSVSGINDTYGKL